MDGAVSITNDAVRKWTSCTCQSRPPAGSVCHMLCIPWSILLTPLWLTRRGGSGSQWHPGVTPLPPHSYFHLYHTFCMANDRGKWTDRQTVGKSFSVIEIWE